MGSHEKDHNSYPHVVSEAENFLQAYQEKQIKDSILFAMKKMTSMKGTFFHITDTGLGEKMNIFSEITNGDTVFSTKLTIHHTSQQYSHVLSITTPEGIMIAGGTIFSEKGIHHKPTKAVKQIDGQPLPLTRFETLNTLRMWNDGDPDPERTKQRFDEIRSELQQNGKNTYHLMWRG